MEQHINALMADGRERTASEIKDRLAAKGVGWRTVGGRLQHVAEDVEDCPAVALAAVANEHLVGRDIAAAGREVVLDKPGRGRAQSSQQHQILRADIEQGGSRCDRCAQPPPGRPAARSRSGTATSRSRTPRGGRPDGSDGEGETEVDHVTKLDALGPPHVVPERDEVRAVLRLLPRDRDRQRLARDERVLRFHGAGELYHQRAEYVGATDAEALDAFALLARSEGIVCAFESAHALAQRQRTHLLSPGLRGHRAAAPRGLRGRAARTVAGQATRHLRSTCDDDP